METIFKSWKTTVAGVVILALVAAFLMGHITLQQFMAAVATAAGGGLMAAQDGGAQ